MATNAWNEAATPCWGPQNLSTGWTPEVDHPKPDGWPSGSTFFTFSVYDFSQWYRISIVIRKTSIGAPKIQDGTFILQERNRVYTDKSSSREIQRVPTKVVSTPLKLSLQQFGFYIIHHSSSCDETIRKLAKSFFKGGALNLTFYLNLSREVTPQMRISAISMRHATTNCGTHRDTL